VSATAAGVDARAAVTVGATVVEVTGTAAEADETVMASALALAAKAVVAAGAVLCGAWVDAAR
jgi:2-keto-3-deoxy-6-phosphogluconate aldolase